MVTKQVLKVTRQPAGYWDDVKNQHAYIRELGKRLGYVQMHDWYKISKREFNNNNGDAILSKFNYSPSKVVMTLFNDHKWEPWKFERTSRSYWTDKTNQLQFMEYLGKKLGYKTKEDFYRITNADIQANGGGYLLSKYGSAPKLLAGIFGGEWQEWKFRQVSPGFWKDPKNSLPFLQSLGDSLGYQKMEDWYNITERQISDHGGLTLLKTFGDSPSDMIRNLFKDHTWYAWKFKKLPQSYFRSMTNLKQYFKYLETQLQIETPNDWYRVSLHQIASYGSVSFVKYFGGYYGALAAVYPKHQWHSNKHEKMLSAKKASQRWLVKKLRELFSHLPESAFKEEYAFPDMQFPGSKEPITVDIYVVPLKLALEYHGAQHYSKTKDASLLKRQKLDSQKKQLLEDSGLNFITIPYWWDLSLESLASTINSRMDIASATQSSL